jgi:ribosome-associated protein
MAETEQGQEGRGRSAQKRAAKAVEQLAQQLADLPEAVLAELPQGPELSCEIELARATRGHASRKRQIKHLAGFLRRHEEQRAAVEAALAERAVSKRREALAFQQLEELRDRLCNPQDFNQALEEVRNSYPMLDHRRISRLARSAHEHADRKAAREIFRSLRKAQEES